MTSLKFRVPSRGVRRAAAAAAMTAIVAVGACSSPPSPAFDLTAPRQRISGGGAVGGQIVVAEPAALQPYESERIVVKDAGGSISFLGGAQWADRLPRLLQAKIIQTFENASRIRAIGRPGDGSTGDYQLTTEIRSFQLDTAAGQTVVEISAKLINLTGGRIVAARVFSARLPVGSANPGEVTQGLDRALSTVLIDIVRWAGTNRQPRLRPSRAQSSPSARVRSAPLEASNRRALARASRPPFARSNSASRARRRPCIHP
jgi:cholesterol transport system auxiliary component